MNQDAKPKKKKRTTIVQYPGGRWKKNSHSLEEADKMFGVGSILKKASLPKGTRISIGYSGSGEHNFVRIALIVLPSGAIFAGAAFYKPGDTIDEKKAVKIATGRAMAVYMNCGQRFEVRYGGSVAVQKETSTGVVTFSPQWSVAADSMKPTFPKCALCGREYAVSARQRPNICRECDATIRIS